MTPAWQRRAKDNDDVEHAAAEDHTARHDKTPHAVARTDELLQTIQRRCLHMPRASPRRPTPSARHDPQRRSSHQSPPTLMRELLLSHANWNGRKYLSAPPSFTSLQIEACQHA